MTARQLGELLEYANPIRSISNLINKKDNTYLKSEEFSVLTKLMSTDGKTYEMRVFNEDGIYEITMISGQP